MIQGLTLATASAPEISSAAASSPASDKGFISVLKSSVQDAAKIDNRVKPASVADTGARDAAASSNPSQEKASTGLRNTTSAEDSAVVKETNEKQLQDSNGILQQLLPQISAIAQQMAQLPVPKDASATGESLRTQGTQTIQAALIDGTTNVVSDNGQSSSAAQTGTETTATSQGENFLAALATSQAAPLNKIDLKSEDKISANTATALSNAEKIAPQNYSADATQGTADSAKAEAETKTLGQDGKDAALLSKTSGSSNNPFSQLNIESGTGQGAGQTAGDQNFVMRSSGLYAQTNQIQTVSGHDQSPVQQTVPASQLSSLDTVISKAVNAGQGNLVIRIDPPDLGSMQIKLSLDNGVLKANVSVDSNAVKDSFNLAMPQIRASLENAGIKVSDFQVDVREDQYRNGQERNNQGQQQRQGKESKNGFSDFFA
jgi:flagellar hook-length control protein FliK